LATKVVEVVQFGLGSEVTAKAHRDRSGTELGETTGDDQLGRAEG
jgi:hypothetical protein